MASRLFKFYRSLPRATNIVASIKRYPPSALRVMGAAVQAFGSPTSPSKFWDMAKKSEDIFQVHVPRLLGNAAVYFKSTKFTDITLAMNHIVSATTTFRDSINASLDARHISFDVFSEELEAIFMAIMRTLEETPLPDKEPGDAERAEMVDNILDAITLGLENLAARYGIEKEVVTTYLLALKPWVHSLVVAVGMSIPDQGWLKSTHLSRRRYCETTSRPFSCSRIQRCHHAHSRNTDTSAFSTLVRLRTCGHRERWVETPEQCILGSI